MLSSTKGDISAPLILILLTVSALAVSALTISWMMGIGGALIQHSVISVSGTPVIMITSNDEATLILTVKNLGSSPAHITHINVEGVSYEVSEGLEPWSTKTLNIALSPYPPKLQNVSSAKCILISNHGPVTFTALVYR